MRISDWSSDVCSSDLTCQIVCAKELAGRRRALAVRPRARREQQAAQKVALPLGALQEGGLLLGREPGKENMQILGHVEDQVAGALAPLLQCPGQGGAVEGRLAHRVDSQRLEAVALTTALAAALGEPLAQRFERGHLAIIEFELLGRSSDRVAPVRRLREIGRAHVGTPVTNAQLV